MRYFVIFVVAIGALSLAGCAKNPVGYRAYGKDGEISEKASGSPQAIKFYISTLDSIKPYVHVFPTGIQTEAPNLDPRYFCPPESTLSWCAGTASASDTVTPHLSLPKLEYEIIGEVETTLSLLKSRVKSMKSMQPPGDSSPIPTEIKDKEIPAFLSPNNKLFRSLPYVDWQEGFDNLRESAASINADAIIEVFCAKGVSSFWYPPTTMHNATYGPNGQVVGSHSTTTPGGIGLTGWKVMGLAVRWKGRVIN